MGKQQGDTIEDYVYDPQGNITSVHDGGANLLRAELYAPQGRHVATWNSSLVNNPGLYWNHADWLGTERVRTNSSHQIAQTCTDTPYGMNASCVSAQADLSAMHFTGLQYDYETGQFHTLNRQYPATLGRWLTADPSGKGAVHLDNPQTWNFYAYVANNPTTLTDPSGLNFWEWIQTQTEEWWEAAGHLGDSGTSAYLTRSGPGGNKKLAQQQNDSSSGTGFWGHVGNLLHGHSWNYEMRESVTTTILPESESEPNPYVTAGTDIAGIAAAVIPKAPELLGYTIAAVSVKNDHSFLNSIMNAASLIPEADVPAAFIGAEADLFNFEAQTVWNGMINAIPGNTIDDGNGHSILNPAVMNECQASGACP